MYTLLRVSVFTIFSFLFLFLFSAPRVSAPLRLSIPSFFTFLPASHQNMKLIHRKNQYSQFQTFRRRIHHNALEKCALTLAHSLAIPAPAQTPATPTKPKSTTTTPPNRPLPTTDRALLKTSRLKGKIPRNYRSNSDTTRGEFTSPSPRMCFPAAPTILFLTISFKASTISTTNASSARPNYRPVGSSANTRRSTAAGKKPPLPYDPHNKPTAAPSSSPRRSPTPHHRNSHSILKRNGSSLGTPRVHSIRPGGWRRA